MPAEGDLIRAVNDPAVYVVQGGKRRWIPDPETLTSQWSWDQVQVLSADVVNSIPLGDPIPTVLQVPIPADGTLIASPDGAVFVMEGGKRRHIPDPPTFEAMGFKWGDIRQISSQEMNAIPLGDPLPPVRVISAQVDSFLGAGHYMTTGVTLSKGKLSGITRTRTVTWFGGFTGGVQVVLVDGNGIVIGASQLRSYGVDGTAIGVSDRTEKWEENVDLGLANQTRSLAVVHGWTPKVPIHEQVKIAIEVARTVIMLIQIIQQTGGHAAQGPQA